MTSRQDQTEEQYFTLVFRGDIRKLPNILFQQTEFGECIVAGVGDAFDKIDALERQIEQAGIDPA